MVAAKHLDDARCRHISTEVDGVPAFHFKQVAKHACTNFMKLATHAGGYNRAPGGSVRPKNVGIELRHNQLRGSGAIVLLSDAENVRLPEPANLILARLKNVAIDFLDADIVLHGCQNEGRSRVPLVVEKGT